MPESVEARDFGIQDGWGIPQASKLRDIVMLSFIEASFPNLSSLQVIFYSSMLNLGINWSRGIKVDLEFVWYRISLRQEKI